MASWFRLFAVALVVTFALARSKCTDEIGNLPGVSFDVKFKHYSGYLQASETRFLHYWFVKSQRDPANDPLILWFNGGPGCSSLFGILAEHGPYHLDADAQTLKENPYSWNKFASVVYVEAPAGIGFSYATDEDDGVYNDNRTSAESYEALQQFFARYPEFRKNKVFIAGESYGGIYVPTFAARILEGQRDFFVNLVGIAIGNGVLDFALMNRTLAEFLYGHGFVSEAQWSKLKQCCNGNASKCNVSHSAGECGQVTSSINDIPTTLWERDAFNQYDLYRDCQSFKWNQSSTRLGPPYILGSMSSCAPDLASYLNNAEVRKALHIPRFVAQWTECSETITNPLFQMSDDVSKEVSMLLANSVRVLLYYGDTDAVCNFLMGQKFPVQLGLTECEADKPWFLNGKLAGFKTTYDEGLTFVTVRGVGHMVPHWAPARAEYLMQKFVENSMI